MSENIIKINSRDDLKNKNLDLNDLKVLDSIQLDKRSYSIGLMKSIIFTAIAVIVFFIPINISGQTDVPFGFIYNFIKDALGLFGLWAITIVIVFNGILSVYGKFFAKESSKIKAYYDGDSKVHPFLYLLGGFFIVGYALDATFTGFSAVSVGFAYMVIKTAGLAEHFLPVYFIALLITLIISFFMCRIPPLSRKSDIYFSGRIQDKEMVKNEASYSGRNCSFYAYRNCRNVLASSFNCRQGRIIRYWCKICSYNSFNSSIDIFL